MGTLCGTELEQVQIPKNDFIQLEVKPENLLIYINQRVPFFFETSFYISSRLTWFWSV